VENELKVEKKKGYFVYLVAFVASFGGFLFGYNLLLMSGANIFLKPYFALNEAQFGFVSASGLFGCVFGPFFGGWLCDKFGRRASLMYAAAFVAISAIGSALPKDIVTFNVFRIIGGIGIGIASVASPMYIAEIAPANIRGKLGLCFQLAIILGCFSAIMVAFLIAKITNDAPDCWRWMFASQLVVVVLFFIFVVIVPRSPRWLVEKGKNKEALNVLTKINGSEEAECEMQSISESMTQETGSLVELLKPGIRIALVIGVLLAVFSQWTGYGAISNYMAHLFQIAGIEKASDAIFQAVITNGVAIVFTLTAMWLVDRVGRKLLWNIASAALAISMVCIGIIFHLNIKGVIVLIAMLMCAWPHMIGVGALPWVIMSEIYPNRLRTKALAITTTVVWLTCSAGIWLFPVLVKLSKSICDGSIIGVFGLYAFVCVLSLIFGLFMLPETKGRTLEEIGASWHKKK